MGPFSTPVAGLTFEAGEQRLPIMLLRHSLELCDYPFNGINPGSGASVDCRGVVTRPVIPQAEGHSFDRLVLSHLDAAYNLARWLSGSDHDAQDIVQDSCVRAMRAFDSFRGGDPRAWLLTIVRNQSLTFLRTRKRTTEFDHELHDTGDDQCNPQAILLRAADAQLVRHAIESLPADLRAPIVLREMEGLSYRQIAAVMGTPIGTVMSRLARGRQRLGEWLTERRKTGEVS